ncbi:condensation domain-containing protein [Dactylosporangium darangshiense]|uniref:condensation domain-containing protein n=1 Tax=Dactylosporangium darangshiense TaxID=579108 RepID=UPI00362837C6
MIPAIFIELDHFPLNTSGKIDHHALPTPDTSRPDLTAHYQAPTTPTEEILAGIWADLLHLDRVGTTDNFFDLGGHSLLATQAITRTRTAFNTHVPLGALFDNPTIAALAATIDLTTTDPATPPITPTDRDQPLPLSFAQQRLWFLHQLEPHSVEYNNLVTITLHGSVDAAALAGALSRVVERHEILRTRLVTGPDGVPAQIVDPPAAFPLEVVQDATEDGARDLLTQRRLTPFDLATGPLLRATLVRLSSDRYVLALCMHHVVSDEWSARLLRRELFAVYHGASLPPLPVQYADYAAWQRRWLTGRVREEQLEYWRTQLADPPVLDLPTDRPRPPQRSSAGAMVAFTVPPQLTAALKELSRSTATTMFMLLHAAYAVLLHRYTGQDDLLVGIPIANRTRAETEHLIGFFVNTLALRTRLHDDPTFAALLARTRDTALAAYAHQDLPFEQLVTELTRDRDRSRTPLVQTLFNYATVDPGAATVSASVSLDDPVLDSDILFDVVLSMAERGDGLMATLEYSTALFDHATARRMAEHLLVLLAGVAADPGRPVSELPMLSAADGAQLAAWNDTAMPLPRTGGIDELVEAMAGRHPDAPAVEDGHATLTYQALDAAANRMARHLLSLGVGPETVVGLHLERGVDVIVAILAVWKAGGAYLPLDPAYPPDRLAYMLRDSGARLLITSRGTATAWPGGTPPTLVVDDPATVAALAAMPAGRPGRPRRRSARPRSSTPPGPRGGPRAPWSPTTT